MTISTGFLGLEGQVRVMMIWDHFVSIDSVDLAVQGTKDAIDMSGERDSSKKKIAYLGHSQFVR